MFTYIILLILCISVNSLECSSQSTCMDCLFESKASNKQNPTCTWNENTCTPRTENKSKLLWWVPFDEECSELDTDYCGTIFQNSNMNEGTFFLPKQSDNTYGKKNLFCKYTYNNFNTNKLLYLEISLNKNVFSENAALDFRAIFTDGSIVNNSLDKTSQLYSANDCVEVDFFFSGKEKFNESPFFVSIIPKNKEGYKNTTSLIIGISATLTCIGFGLTIFICCLRLCRKRRGDSDDDSSIYEDEMNEIRHTQRFSQRQDEFTNQIGQSQRISQRRNEEEEKKRIQKEIDILLTKTIPPISYSQKLKEYNDSCSICLDSYNNGDKVARTPCNHVFHHNCLKDWVQKNPLNCKCPNCNADLHQKNKGKDNREENYIQSNEIINVQRQSNVHP